MATIETTTNHAPRLQAEDHVLAGGGVMGALMRAYDWAASPLGPVSEWPPCLRAAVSLALNSQFPTIIFWGPDLLMLYNDAYLPIADDKHPAALGRPAREFWSEVWSIAGPMLHGVLETGEATWSYDLLLPIIRNGAVGEHYFTFSYSPIRDEDGAVRGVFCPVTETTARRQGERREQALRQEAEAARDQVTYVLESMHDSFVAFDSQWRITAINASAAESMHHRREDLPGKVYWEEFPPTRDTNLYPAFQRAMADRVPVECESYYPPWACWYDVRVYPAIAGGLSVFFRDITARKQAEAALHASEERLRLATDSAGVGIWYYYVQEDRLLWSPQFKRLFGLPPDDAELTYEKFLTYVHPQDLERMNTVVGQVIAEGRDLDIEYRIVWPDGSVHWIAAKGSAFHDDTGRAVRFTGVALDATARKQAEEAREGLLAELQRINDELQQFAHIVSHDLNEPLRTVSNYVQLLARRYLGKLDTDADDYIALAVDGAQRMQRMITDLLAYTRAGQTPEFQAVDYEAVLAQVLDSLQAQITECGAVITHDPLPTVQGDATRLEQVLQNLIGNALKFCTTQPRIHISAHHEDQHWHFAVRDNGIGIDPTQAGKLFQVFQRLHSRSEYPGTGIGLAICKRIVEQHGGRIWVDSRPGERSIFYFTISDEGGGGRTVF